MGAKTEWTNEEVIRKPRKALACNHNNRKSFNFLTSLTSHLDIYNVKNKEFCIMNFNLVNDTHRPTLGP